MIRLHTLSPLTKRKRSQRIGRGGKRGTYSGRGLKGQKSRAGGRIRPAIRDYMKQIPKLRGFRFKSRRDAYCTINIRDLCRNFSAGDTITPEALFQVKLARKSKGRIPQIKVLGGGEMHHPVHLHSLIVSKSARQKIEADGGTIQD